MGASKCCIIIRNTPACSVFPLQLHMNDLDPTLAVENVTKRFGDFTAVDDLSFSVRAGRVFGFLGPNGAGKTTTIRMIVGITAPDSGRIDYRFARDESEGTTAIDQDSP